LICLTFGLIAQVFDPDRGGDRGPCDPGSHGPPPPAKRNCTECEIGKWCPGQHNGGPLEDIVNDCPPHSTTLAPGAYKMSDCICSPGWHGKPSYTDAQNCKK